MSELILSQEYELIAQAMLKERGNIAKASRAPSVEHNAMSLRVLIKDRPEIRQRYQELLADELQDKGVFIAERLRRMIELQESAFGQTIEDSEGNDLEIPADPKTVIELSKEISRLIAEGKQQPFSAKAADAMVSKEGGEELLLRFLES